LSFINSEDANAVIPLHHYDFRATDDNTNFMIERKYTLVFLIDKLSDIKEKIHKDEIVLSFIISLLPRGKMSDVLSNIKCGKTLLINGPLYCSNEFLNKIDDGVNNYKKVFCIAAGTGILSMIQIINHYLFRLDQKEVRFYLIWLLKSPKHNYGQILELDELSRKSGRYFKCAIIYTSRAKDKSFQLLKEDASSHNSMHSSILKSIKKKIDRKEEGLVGVNLRESCVNGRKEKFMEL